MSNQLLDAMLQQHPPKPKPRTPLGPRSAVIRSMKRPAPVAQPVTVTARGAIAESAVAFLWLIGWGLNGLSTVALGWLPFVNWFAGKLGHGDALWLSLWLQVPFGIIVHILISRIEQDLWRQVKPPTSATIEERVRLLLTSVRTYEAVVIGSLDTLTAALGVMLFCTMLGYTQSMTLLLTSAVLGTLLAMVVEPMLKLHGAALRQMLWGRS